jgi:vancomycin resistance protein YoaR
LATRGQLSPRARKRARRLLWQRTAAAIGGIAIVLGVLGLVFAGSPTRVPDGVTIAGIDVGGQTPVEARKSLEARSQAVADRPVVFSVAGHRWKLTAKELDVRVNWTRAVSSALHQGDGPVPVRGFRRLGVRLFGADITPAAQAYDPALQYELDRFAHKVNHPHRDASIALKRRTPVVVPARPGIALDRDASERMIVQALASLERPLVVTLPVKVDPPEVATADLRPVAAQVRRAVSAPVQLIVRGTSFTLKPYRIAHVLDLPRAGTNDLAITNFARDSFLYRLRRSAELAPRNADFAPIPNGVRLVPSRLGSTVDVAASGRALLRAALSPTHRVARLVTRSTQPKVTTAKAKTLGIKEIVGSYTTIYGGIANRIHNVQLVAHLIDHHYIAPGEEFSFNKTTGVRDAAKGFLEAPVIINGELQTGLGGGVCQVSTTVFNAAYVAGLKITSRTNHALYISHYPLGRDATVNYPDTDLKFVNDTKHWLLLRTFVGSSSLTVNLYGTSPHRRVETVTAPLTIAGPVPVRETEDPNLLVGQQVVDEAGSPALQTSVERKVFDRQGRLIYDDHWSSHYRGEYRLVRIGTKKPPVKVKPTTTTQTTTGTGTTTSNTTPTTTVQTTTTTKTTR